MNFGTSSGFQYDVAGKYIESAAILKTGPIPSAFVIYTTINSSNEDSQLCFFL